MQFKNLPTELLIHIFLSCTSITDILHLASATRRFHRILNQSNKLQILYTVAATEFSPIDEIVQLVTQNESQPVHIRREAPISVPLLVQIVRVGQVARKWEAIYPLKKWKADYENRRLLSEEECWRVRRAVYRVWLYHRAFHTRVFDRFTRGLRGVVLERAQLLHNWSTVELAEMEDVRRIMEDVVRNHVCPSNGTIERKFRKRFPLAATGQLTFNFLPFMPTSGKAGYADHFYTMHPMDTPGKYRSRFRNDFFHDPGYEGWGDEIPHYYVVQDMMKLDPGQVLWLRDHAPMKEQVEDYIVSLGEWFRDNGETFGDTLTWVMHERGEHVGELRIAIEDRYMGVVTDPQLSSFI